MKQKTDVELLSDEEIIAEVIPNKSNDPIKVEHIYAALSIKSNQLQATVDELKNRCEELEKSNSIKVTPELFEKLCEIFDGQHYVNPEQETIERLQFLFDNLLTPNERK